MKKINAIFSEKMSKALLPIKTRKVMSAIDAGLLNAEDDLQSSQLRYEEVLATLPTTSCIGSTITDAVVVRKRINEIKENIEYLKQVKADLESEVEVQEDEEK